MIIIATLPPKDVCCGAAPFITAVALAVLELMPLMPDIEGIPFVAPVARACMTAWARGLTSEPSMTGRPATVRFPAHGARV